MSILVFLGQMLVGLGAAVCLAIMAAAVLALLMWFGSEEGGKTLALLMFIVIIVASPFILADMGKTAITAVWGQHHEQR